MQWERSTGKRNTCRVLIQKPEGKRPLGRPKHRWNNPITMDLKDGMP
jgi:hypothetical protein